MLASKPSIAQPKDYPQKLDATELGNDDTLSWTTQSTSAPDTNLAHYPRLMYYYHPDYLGHVEYITDLDGVPYQYFYFTAPIANNNWKSGVVTNFDRIYGRYLTQIATLFD
jgi:hypothetical protein